MIDTPEDWKARLNAEQQAIQSALQGHLAPGQEPPKTLLATRATTHGDFSENARIAQKLREAFRYATGWRKCNAIQCEALDMIACKISRILSGNPNHPDHWDDISGYAQLARSDGNGE